MHHCAPLSPSLRFGLAPAYAQGDGLAPTPDANSTDPLIIAKAAELGNDPLRIFAFVRDEIGYESYVGSLRGARGTLWNRAGNALDQASLLIALLRASDIPARYAQGTLSDGRARALIASMFPAPLRITGFVPEGAERADPVDDPQLLAETREHHWVQFGPGFLDADPTFAGAQIGEAFADAQETFSEVPDALRHKVRLRLNRELTTPAAGLLSGGSSQDVATVLDATFNTAALTGKPLSIGHFVNRQPLVHPVFPSATTTYSPYIAEGDFARSMAADHLIRGTDYSEVITSFPLGNEVLTGLFLEIDLSGPDGPAEKLERTLVDLIGFDVRQNGGRPHATFDPNGPPTLTDLDIFTVNVVPSRFESAALSAFTGELTAIQETLQGLQNDDGSLPPQASVPLRQLAIGVTRLNSANFFVLSDLGTLRMAEAGLVKAYFARPRVIIAATRTVTDTATSRSSVAASLDLRRDTIRAVAYPGQNVTVLPAFQVTRGLMENGLESGVLQLQTPEGEEAPAIVSTATIFRQAAAAGVGLARIGADNLSELDTLAISAQAKARITQAVSRGVAVVVPTRSVVLGGEDTTGWYEIDPVSGETVGVTEDGGHQALTEYPSLLSLVAFLTGGALISFGSLVACVFSGYTFETCKEALIFQLEGTAFLLLPALASVLITAWAAAFLAGVATVAVASILVDPPLAGFLVSPLPADGLMNLTGIGVAMGVVADPMFTLPVGGALLPTVFRVGIKNTGIQTDTFALAVSDLPAGFEAVTSVPEIEVAPGATAEVGLALRPTGVIPSAGSNAGFRVTVTSTSNPGVTAEVDQAFVVPAVSGITLAADPARAGTTPGAPVDVALSVRAAGNVPSQVTFALTAPSDLAVDGLTPLTLDPGEAAVRTLTLTPAAATPLNTTLTATIRADTGAPEPQTIAIPVRVAAPGADAIANASETARQLGDDALANRLGDLGIALTNLALDPDDAVFKSQALAALDSIISQLANDRRYAAFVDDLTALRDTLAAASTAAEIQAAASGVGVVLETLADGAAEITRHDVEAVLTPNSLVAQPQTPAIFELRLRNVGTETTAYDLSLGTLPAGVTGQLGQSAVTLARGELASIAVTLTQTSDAELLAFDFEVTVTAHDAPSVTRTVPGALTVRNAVVSVVEVVTDPPFTDPGGAVAVSARVLNAVNRQQQATVSYTVRNADGQQVFASPAVPVTLTTQASLVTIDLAVLDTAGFALGQYAIDVTVSAPGEQPLATGSGTLLIGSPVTAAISIAPSTLPPGDGVVTNTLRIDSQDAPDTGLAVRGLVPIGDFGNDALHGVTVQNGFAYVFGDGGLHVVDVSNPDAPAYLRNVGEGGHRAGIAAGDRIVAILPGPASAVVPALARGAVSYFDLAGIFGTPSQPGRVASVVFPYQSATALAVSGNDVFVATNLVCFNSVTKDIFSQHGDLLSFDFTSFLALQQLDVLFNTSGTTQDPGKTPGCWENGGNFNVFAVEQVAADTLLLASSTATGSDAQTGVGRIRVVDASDPANLQVLDAGELQIPGTVQVHGIAVGGERALAIATQGGWRDPFTDVSDIGPTGDIVLATVDLSDVRHPQLLQTQPIDRAARGLGRPVALGNDRFAFASFGALGDTPQLIVIDAGGPELAVLEQLDTPGQIRGVARNGSLLYASGDDGLTIYDPSGGGIPITARVRVPRDGGVEVVPGSFNIPPTGTSSDEDADVLTWNLSGDQTVTWSSTVTGLQPGEARAVTLGTTIDFVVDSTPGQITLPPTAVSGDQVLFIDPAARTARPGEEATYSLILRNPTGAAVLYDLSVQGLPQPWLHLASPIAVAANGETTVPVSVTAEPFAALAEYEFVISATAGSTSSSVGASLLLEGLPVLPVLQTDAHGVIVSVSPGEARAGQGTGAQFTVRVTNTGSRADRFDLSAALPDRISRTFAMQAVVVSPGASNFREVTLTLVPAAGTPAGDYPFMVDAHSAGSGSTASAAGLLRVTALGVDITLAPASGTPASLFQATVRNSGQVSETFDLTLEGPLALGSEVDPPSVTLAPNASRSVAVGIGGVDFATPGALELIATATARTDAAIADRAAAAVTIAATSGLTAEFEPDVVVIPAPGAAGALLVVHNTGNAEDAYRAVITGVTGPLMASLVGLDGAPVQMVPILRVPGLTSAILSLDAVLSTRASGTVTVTVTSLSQPSRVATASVVIGVGEVGATPTPVPTVIPTPTATPLPCTQPCVCDCDGDCTVFVNEMVRSVLIALGELAVDECAAADRNRDGMATIDELVGGVRNVLQGCPDEAAEPHHATLNGSPGGSPSHVGSL